jgi:hypothetical protein
MGSAAGNFARNCDFCGSKRDLWLEKRIFPVKSALNFPRICPEYQCLALEVNVR